MCSHLAVKKIEDDALVAVRAPPVEGGIEIAAGIRAVAQVPPEVGIEFGFQYLADAVRQIKAVDEAGGLAAVSAGVVAWAPVKKT